MNARLASAIPVSIPSLVSAVGAVLTVCAVGVWAYKLYAPMPQPAPAVAAAKPADDGRANGIAQWLAPGPEKVNVKVAGAIISGEQGGVVLSVNGGPPRAYVAGDSLAQSVVLDSIEIDSVVLDQDGKMVRVPMPLQPALPAGGIVPVRTGQ